MRLQLRAIRRRAVRQKRAAPQPLRARRQGYRPDAQAARGRIPVFFRPKRAFYRYSDSSSRGQGRGGTLARQPGRGDVRFPRAAQQAGLRERDLAHRVRSFAERARLRGRRRVRALPDQRPRAGRGDPQGAGRAARFSDRRPHAARGADRRRRAGAGAGHAVPALLLHHRRRAPEKSQGAGRRRRSRRRRRDARRARGDREISRRAARPGGLHRGARSAAAAALFDRVVAQGASRPRRAHRRHGALRYRQRFDQAHAARRRLDFPRPPRQSGRPDRRRRTPSGCRRIRRCRSS